ncbi:AN1-type zinc finger protein 3-like [Corythoichthys intestinalis]|uniref:AN1-type zinc finger protein 3-like n=1 Tax=Corythoichthys intestinalis TaxID=161448 RepID=UPI0025A54AEC|nr:AN1-type zinc finger protein 3-like [Corythoichthys intestinalis]XP_061806336.1 AN1-type zinc finger protein 3-like [Nerophis lumbriciformis]
MGDTSERSKPPGLPPRCPCGFWGSSKTMNLCSKCFADIQKKQPGEDRPTKSGSPSPVFGGETATPANADKSPSISAPAAGEPSPLFVASVEGTLSTVTAQGTTRTPTKRPRESGAVVDSDPVTSLIRAGSNPASTSESEATPEKRPRVEAKDGEGGGEEEEKAAATAAGTPKQKNRRRCFSCQSKLELVQQELGSCRCGYVFCMLHRLPEQHDCLFDHLGRGREEAVLKMVKLDRKVGRSCQRIGEECS